MQGGGQASDAVLIGHMSRTSGIPFIRPSSEHASERGGRGGWSSAADRRRSGRGQSLVEFSLVFPFFLILLFSVIEFSFALNALLSVDFATREAALAAAEAGTRPTPTARSCEPSSAASSRPPTTADSPRSGSTSRPPMAPRRARCTRWSTRASGSIVPARWRTALRRPCPTPRCPVTYTSDTRCNTLARLRAGSVSVDTIGVEATYDYRWAHAAAERCGPRRAPGT